MSLQINIMQGFRAIALHHLPIVCRSSGTSILEYIGKYFKFRIEKKTGNLGCFVCPLPVFFSLNYQPFLATLPIFLLFLLKKNHLTFVVRQFKILLHI